MKIKWDCLTDPTPDSNTNAIAFCRAQCRRKFTGKIPERVHSWPRRLLHLVSAVSRRFTNFLNNCSLFDEFKSIQVELKRTEPMWNETDGNQLRIVQNCWTEEKRKRNEKKSQNELHLWNKQNNSKRKDFEIIAMPI